MHEQMLSSAAFTASAIAHFRVVQSGSAQAQNGSLVLRTKPTQGNRIVCNDHMVTCLNKFSSIGQNRQK